MRGDESMRRGEETRRRDEALGRGVGTRWCEEVRCGELAQAKPIHVCSLPVIAAAAAFSSVLA